MMIPFFEMRPLRQSLEWMHFKGDALTHHQSQWLEHSSQEREVRDSQPPPPPPQVLGSHLSKPLAPSHLKTAHWQTLLSWSTDDDDCPIFQPLRMIVRSPLSPRTTNLLLGEMILSGFHDGLTCSEPLSPSLHTLWTPSCWLKCHFHGGFCPDQTDNIRSPCHRHSGLLKSLPGAWMYEIMCWMSVQAVTSTKPRLCVKGKGLKTVKSWISYKCNMNTSQKFLLNSFIQKGTRKMLILKGERKGQRNIWASEMLRENAQIVAKLARVVNTRGARINRIPRDTICISMNKNHLHCYQLSAIYRAVK